MLVSEIEDKNEETEENNGCNVFSVAVAGNNAVISFETIVDATMLVAIYNESCDTLIATGTTEVKKGETEKNVTLDTENMPQYFYVKGYLIDTATSKPLCTAYSSPMYTKEMQEFLAKTTDDFDENKVLNFDNEDDNNFAVYNEDVKLVDDSGDTNKVTKSDDTTKSYVIENIDESISSLKEGDIFSYNYSEGNALVVKVATITIDGTTATITGADTEINEVFDYMKIDSTAKKSDYTYDGSDVDDGVTVLKTDNDNKRNSRNARAIVDVDNSDSFSMSFGFDYAKEKEVSIGGSLSTTFTTKIKVYVSLFYQYIELTVSQVSKFNVNISVNFPEISIKLGEFSIIPVAGLRICFEPALVVSGKITVNLNFTLTSKAGFSYSSDNGFKNLSTTDDPGIELNVTGELFIGIKITVKVLVAEKLANFGITGKAGILINLKVSTNQISDSVKHECLQCAEGEINAKISVSPYAKFLDSDKLKLEDTFSISFKLCDIYYSKSHLEFGFTTCPHKKYKVTVVVKDSNGNLVKDAYINGAQKTDATGTAIVYLPKGQNEVSVLKDDKVTQKIVEVLSAAKSTVIIIPAKQDSSEENPDYEPVITGEIAQIAAGGNSSAAVMKDGTLYTWGSNGNGQLGTYSKSDVKYVSIGNDHSALITKNGSLYMWGNNNYGQLGDGTTTSRTSPIKIMDNVVSASVGDRHSAAVTADGSLYTWGYNYYGQLGNKTITNSSVPVKIMSNVKTVSLGNLYSAAITKDGSLYTWGYSENGEIGTGSTAYTNSTPTKIMENVIQVELGVNHSAAITEDGSLYTWGYNFYGQLGNGTTVMESRPVRVARNVQSVSLGSGHTTAVSKDGALYTWGCNYDGRLGNSSDSNSSTPIKIMSNVVSCAAGYNHTLILKKDGTVYACGENSSRQLGDETNTNKLSPVKISIYDRIPVLHSIKEPLIPVGASSTQRTAKFTGYSANGIYNFYSVKDKNADKLLTDDNILYVDQVRADANGNINVTYNAKADCVSPYEFVASITQIDIGNAEVTAESLTYNGKMQTVEPVVKVNGYTLYSGIDYELTGAYEAKNAGEYTYTIIGKGDFVGYTTKTFTINPADVNTCDASSISAKTYTGTEIQPDVELTMDNDTLKKDVDYTVEYQNNVNAGIGIVVIKGMGNYSGRKVCWFDITKCDVSKINITIPICTYYGDTVIPEMFIENNGVALVKDKDYTVTFKNNDSVGTATAVITGIGNYSGTVEKKFQIREPFGDVDMNGKIDVNDVTIIMAYNVELMNLSSEQLKFADVNEDGYVDVSDATLIQQYIADCI